MMRVEGTAFGPLDSAGNVKIWENTPKCDLDFGHCSKNNSDLGWGLI